MKTLMRILITCAKANLPLRGHNESEESLNKGVFLELVDLVENESQTFHHLRSKVPENAKYTSGMRQNAMLSAISDCALDVIGDELRSAPFYAGIADETRDIQRHQKLFGHLQILLLHNNYLLELLHNASYYILFTP